MHTAVGKFTFRILAKRSVDCDESDIRHYQEVGFYNPGTKAHIVRLLLTHLEKFQALKKVINQPGKNGLTPLNQAVIAALVFSKSGYNSLEPHSQYNHTKTIELLLNHGARITEEQVHQGRQIPQTIQLAENDSLKKCCAYAFPSDVLRLYRYSLLNRWNTISTHITEDCDFTANPDQQKLVKSILVDHQLLYKSICLASCPECNSSRDSEQS